MRLLKGLLSGAPLNRDLGLLILRVGIGLSMLILHGWGKITGGPELWENVGGSMSNLGLNFAPKFWGFLAAFAESVGSVLLILGLFFRPAALMLTFTMLVAMVMHLSLPEDNPGSGWNAASHAMELMLVYLALFLMGSGKFALATKRGRA
ncbi:MAG: DoxX family protein [Candidatus Eisenbacteria bacterium]|uniref:DoxX family protein n=1 Tax=Eiseniibacteriota bacterium TaxID=2212470 RepID=A0A7Y2E8N2_UNCEI|nr:DoxX family protein [Candidatus Eisenbacteria bacterium]